MSETIILGAGVTGLSAGFKKRRSIYERANWAGGICTSYYVDGSNGTHSSRESKDNFHFEFGGGHWIFGGDPKMLNFLKSLSPLKNYQRKASVYFPDLDLYIPYPLQNNLHGLPAKLRQRIKDDLQNLSFNGGPINTMEEWLLASFGKTLCDLFFFPFHDLYTAGLYRDIAPQDGFKSPVKRELILKGLKEKTSPVGYNTTFAYPKYGLDHLIGQMKKHCNIRYNKNTLDIDLDKKRIYFQDGTEVAYRKLISTVPLNEMIRVCKSKIQKKDPCTSVVVFNLGATKGRRCPADHWVYIPKTKSGFHRVGFYSNVDKSFLPKTDKRQELVSIYVEKAFVEGDKPNEDDLAKLGKAIVDELKEWQYIKDVKVFSPTWIDTAYTWQFPESTWKKEALEYFQKHDVVQVGRYGTWKFQGILESIKDGLSV